MRDDLAILTIFAFLIGLLVAAIFVDNSGEITVHCIAILFCSISGYGKFRKIWDALK